MAALLRMSCAGRLIAWRRVSQLRRRRSERRSGDRHVLQLRAFGGNKIVSRKTATDFLADLQLGHHVLGIVLEGSQCPCRTDIPGEMIATLIPFGVAKSATDSRSTERT